MRFGRYIFVLFVILLSFTLRLFSLDPTKQVSQYVHSSWGLREGLPQVSVLSIVQARNGYLWMATEDGLVRFDGVEFKVFDKNSSQGQLKTNRITVLYKDSHEFLWIGTHAGGIAYINLETNSFASGPLGGPFEEETVNTICEDKHNRIWVGTNRGLYQINRRSHTDYSSRKEFLDKKVNVLYRTRGGGIWVGTDNHLVQVENGKITATYTMPTNGQNNSITAIFEDNAMNLWIGTETGIWKKNNNTFLSFTYNNGHGNRQFKYKIKVIYQDRQGNLWFGTENNGISRLNGNKLDTFTGQQGMSFVDVRSILEDREGCLWIGTYYKGLNRLKDGLITTFSTREGLTDQHVRSVYQDQKGNIWIGTENGLNYYRKGKIDKFVANNRLPDGHARTILESSDGSLWVGTEKGLIRWRQGKLTTYTTADGLSENIVTIISEDQDRNIWIGTINGLNCFKNGSFTRVDTGSLLTDRKIRAIYEAKDGTLWLATDNGLKCIKKGRLTAYKTENSLSSTFTLDILGDIEDRYLWIAVENGGLNRFDIEEGRFISITEKNGLFNDTIHRILADDFGYLWMSSNKGIFRVSRESLMKFCNGSIHRVACESYNENDGMKIRECNGAVQPAGWKSRDGKLWFPTVDGVAMIEPAKMTPRILPPPVIIEEVRVDEQVRPSGEGNAATTYMSLPPGTHRVIIKYTAPSLLEPEKVKFRYRLEGHEDHWGPRF